MRFRGTFKRRWSEEAKSPITSSNGSNNSIDRRGRNLCVPIPAFFALSASGPRFTADRGHFGGPHSRMTCICKQDNLSRMSVYVDMSRLYPLYSGVQMAKLQ